MKTIVAFLALLTALNGFAQDKVSFSLDEAVDYALKNSYAMKNANLDIESAQKKVWETITDGLPNVTASADYTKNLELSTQLIPGEFFGEPAGTYIPVKFGQEYSSNWGFNVSQLIFDGSYIVGLQAARVYVDLSRNAEIKSSIEIANAVEQAYYTVLVAQRNKDLLEQNVTVNTDLLKETKAYYEAGFREELDVDQMELMLNRSKTEVLKADRQIEVSKMVLKYVMGIEAEREIELNGNLDESIAPLASNTSTASEFSAEGHIDYRVLKTQYEAKELQMKNEYAAYLPKISAFYNFRKSAYGDNANLFSDTTSWYPTKLIGVQVSVPIIQFGRMWSRAKQAKIEVEKIENDMEQTRQNLNKELLTALTNLETASETYRNDKKSSEIAKKIYNKTQIKYDHGVATSVELSQNEQQYIQAHAAYIGSMMNLLNAKINLDKALGKL